MLFDEDHFPFKIKEEGNKSSVKGSLMILDNILQENEKTFCDEELCDETTIREATSPNEMEISLCCLRLDQRIRRPSSILRDPSFECNISIESEMFERFNVKKALCSLDKAKWEEAKYIWRLKHIKRMVHGNL